MTQQFQLVCDQCQNVLVVEPRNAGNTLKCGNCQAAVDVPKLRDLKQLEPVAQSAKPQTGRDWGQLSGGLFVFGILLLAIAIGSCVYLQVLRQRYRPYTEKPKIEEANFSLDQASLTDTWRFWESLLEVTDVSLRNEPIFLQARDAVKRLDFWQKIFYGVATVGILSVLGSIFARPKAVS